MTGQVRRLVEGDGLQLSDEPVAQRLRVTVRREVVAFLADLADASRVDRAAGVVGFNASLNYPAGSVGAAVKTALAGGVGGGSGWTSAQLLAALAGLLGPSELTTQLRGRIDLIDAPGGLVDQVAGLTTTYGSTASAAVSAVNAASSATQAATAQINAVAASAAAAVSSGEALTRSTAAQTARVGAETAAGSAAASSTSSADSATSAAGSAATASSQSAVASFAATAASTSASGAAISQTSASSAATAAATSATVADQRRIEAQTAASSATSSAGSAASSVTTAQGAAATASSQSGLAASAAMSASNDADAAATSASSSAVSATNAATSEAAAVTQAGLAATSSNSAGSSAAASAASQNSAATSAGAASTSASAASTARVAAETASGTAAVASGSAASSATSANGSAVAAASHYDATVAATGGLTASVATLSTAVSGPDGLQAQHVLKVSATRTDGKKVFAAIGLASQAAGAIGESQILLQASRLMFVPDGDLNATPSNMLVVGVVNGVTTLIVPAARIGDATIGTLTVVANAFTDVVSTNVAAEDYDYPSSTGLQDRFFEPVEVANASATAFTVEVTVTSARKLTTPAGLVGAVNLNCTLSILNVTDSIGVTSLVDWLPELISAVPAGVTSAWAREALAFSVVIPAGKTYRFTPRSRVFPQPGSTGITTVITRAFCMRVTSCKR